MNLQSEYCYCINMTSLTLNIAFCMQVGWNYIQNIVAAFQGMHVSPAKHSYAWLSRKCDYRTDRHTHTQTDAGQSDPYVPLCFAGDTTNGGMEDPIPRYPWQTFLKPGHKNKSSSVKHNLEGTALIAWIWWEGAWHWRLASMGQYQVRFA